MLSIRDLQKTYFTDTGRVQAVQGITFKVEQGNFHTLLGPSGCGKTTTLQCIAGLETPEKGEIIIGGEVVFASDRRINVPAHRRDLGVVFQSYAIWPHMSVFENVAFPLVHGKNKRSKNEVKDRVMRYLELVKLSGLEHRPVPFLSGGQQQRVALARALVHEPRLLLLDEPMSNLDARLREEMRIELQQLVKSLNITTIYVTHDQVEALSMSDHITLMRDGLIIQEGTPYEVYTKPQDIFAADFIGRSNIIPAHIVSRSSPDQHGRVKTVFGDLDCMVPTGYKEGDEALILIRPEAIHVYLKESDLPHHTNVFFGQVSFISFVGDSVEIRVRIGSHMVRVKSSPYLNAQVGSPVYLEIPLDRCVILRNQV